MAPLPHGRPWDQLGVALHPHLLAALRTFGFDSATPVQAVSIPPLLRRQDVAVEAETGSGKTLAFLIPAVQTILTADRHCPRLSVLVLEPTRELARQVHSVATSLVDGTSLRVGLLTGGKARDADSSPLAPADILVATPGRLDAALSSGAVDVRELDFLVLDEADRLLDLGFDVALSSILAKLPKQRRTGLYSATQTQRVQELARAGLRNPVRVTVERVSREAVEKSAGSEKPTADRQDTRTPATLQSFYSIHDQEQKLTHLVNFLLEHPTDKFMVYFLTCRSVEFHATLPWGKLLNPAPSPHSNPSRKVHAMHGKLTQPQRHRALHRFESSAAGVLLCTDVAARGLDIPNVNWIVQFDPPQDPDAYVHRVGRTARMGRSGKALLYLTRAEEGYVEFLRIRKCPVGEWRGGVDAGGPRVDGEWVRQTVREAVLEDREIMEKGEKAFLSFLRGYKEHRCSYLLEFDKLDMGSVARSFHMLRLPRIAEFKKFRAKIDFEPDRSVDLKKIKFRSRELERQRQAKLAKALEAPRKRARSERGGELTKGSGGGKQKKKRPERPQSAAHELDDDEMEELARDARKLKKRRRGVAVEDGSDSDDGLDEVE